MTTHKAYEEVIDFSDLVAFEPSEEAKKRVLYLIEQEKAAAITPEEKSELDHYMQLEHLMRLAKARARRHLLDE